MKQAAIWKRADELLRKRRAEAFFVLLACLLIGALCFLLELLVQGLLLRFPDSMLSALLAGSWTARDGITLLRIALSFCAFVPVCTGACWWFWQMANGERDHAGRVVALYASLRLNLRALLLYALLAVISVLSWLPSLCCVTAASVLLRCTLLHVGDGLLIFLAAQFLVLAVVLLLWRLHLLLGILPAVFLFVEQPLASPISLLMQAARQMRHKRLQLLALLLHGGIWLLPLVTIPIALPRLCMGVALFLGEIRKEKPRHAGADI